MLELIAALVTLQAGTALVAPITVSLESSDYFSDRNVRGRRFERQRKEEEEQRKEAIRERRKELARLDKERKEAEERERVLRFTCATDGFLTPFV